MARGGEVHHFNKQVAITQGEEWQTIASSNNTKEDEVSIWKRCGATKQSEGGEPQQVIIMQGKGYNKQQ